jgi:hypothetical protein
MSSIPIFNLPPCLQLTKCFSESFFLSKWGTFDFISLNPFDLLITYHPPLEEYTK